MCSKVITLISKRGKIKNNKMSRKEGYNVQIIWKLSKSIYHEGKKNKIYVVVIILKYDFIEKSNKRKVAKGKSKKRRKSSKISK